MRTRLGVRIREGSMKRFRGAALAVVFSVGIALAFRWFGLGGEISGGHEVADDQGTKQPPEHEAAN
jgi:hypothetical protein